jgi:hypothetical protein
MKMGTIGWPRRYDAAARHASQSANLRLSAILHYALWAAAVPISRVVRLLFGGRAESRHRRDVRWRTSAILHFPTIPEARPCAALLPTLRNRPVGEMATVP